MNPLLNDFSSPFDTIPFGEILPEHFSPAFEQAFKEAYEDLDKIISNQAAPNFGNTIHQLEEAGKLLDRISAILFNLNHAETCAEIQQLAAEMAPRLTAFSNDITLNADLFERIHSLREQKETLSLSPEQKMLLDKTHKNFIRSGAHLKDDQKEEFRKISGRLSELSVKFGENVLAETNEFILHITRKEELEGLPDQIIQAAAELASMHKMEGWAFNLQFPSFVPFMKYAINKSLRKEMYLAYGTRGLQGNPQDNREIIREIVNLRASLAHLLGYKSFAAYVLDNRMAEKEENVFELIDELKAAYLPAAHKEVDEIKKFASSCKNETELMPWDWSFYAEKLRDKKYSVNDELIRPYFELDHCVREVFALANQLYGISFNLRKDIQTYQQEVEAWEVKDEKDQHLAILYMDYFPREGKKPGAWMTEYRSQYIRGEENIRPHVSLVFNFPRPVQDTPSLLNYGELRTLLHEFGHSLHAIFSQVHHKSLSGTSVYRDFVELPSQIMENWAEQAEWLQEIGKHHQSGEAIPKSLIQKLIDSKNFNEGYAGCRQLSFGLLDMAWHSLKEDFTDDVIAFEKETMAPLSILPEIKETAMSPSFGHIFSGGYAAGYYGYKWAEVLDADAFSRFLKDGIFNPETAGEFREKILSKGGSKHPMELYKDFMGREPGIDALLQRSGFSRAKKD